MVIEKTSKCCGQIKILRSYFLEKIKVKHDCGGVGLAGNKELMLKALQAETSVYGKVEMHVRTEHGCHLVWAGVVD